MNTDVMMLQERCKILQDAAELATDSPNAEYCAFVLLVKITDDAEFGASFLTDGPTTPSIAAAASSVADMEMLNDLIIKTPEFGDEMTSVIIGNHMLARCLMPMSPVIDMELTRDITNKTAQRIGKTLTWDKDGTAPLASNQEGTRLIIRRSDKNGRQTVSLCAVHDEAEITLSSVSAKTDVGNEMIAGIAILQAASIFLNLAAFNGNSRAEGESTDG